MKLTPEQAALLVATAPPCAPRADDPGLTDRVREALAKAPSATPIPSPSRSPSRSPSPWFGSPPNQRCPAAIDADEPEVIEDMTAEQARAITDEIKAHVEVVWRLIATAYRHRAWIALGYESWDDYAREEFDVAARIRLSGRPARHVVRRLRVLPRRPRRPSRGLAWQLKTSPGTVPRTLDDMEAVPGR